MHPPDERRLLESLPHAPPFRFVDRVLSATTESARGIWSVRGDEAFFAGHFPSRPIVPGVLLSEPLAQLSGLIIASRADLSDQESPIGGALAMVEMKFVSPAVPPVEIELASELDAHGDPLYLFSVVASCGGVCLARGRLAIRVDSKREGSSCATS